MKMSTRRYAFKLNDTTRLIKSAIAAGLPSERLRLVHDLLGHKISVELRDKGGGGEDANPWLSDLNVKKK
jgi:hypothetical protein